MLPKQEQKSVAEVWLPAVEMSAWHACCVFLGCWLSAPIRCGMLHIGWLAAGAGLTGAGAFLAAAFFLAGFFFGAAFFLVGAFFLAACAFLGAAFFLAGAFLGAAFLA